jgi:signal transduction histidine kinase
MIRKSILKAWSTPNLWRATPAIALSGAVALLVAGLAIALLSEYAYTRQKIREVTVQGQILASTVSAALAFSDRNAAMEYVDALRADPEVLSAAIYDASGARFASFSRTDDTPAPDRLPTVATIETNLRLAVVTPVVQGAAHLGSVYLQVTADPPARRFARFGLIALLTTMATLVVAVLGVAHTTLSRANASLQLQAMELAQANQTLLQQIDEREKAEAALRQAQKMEAIGHLTGGVAHDFNNLLQIILSCLTLIKRRAVHWSLPPAAVRDFDRCMEGAVSSSERAAALVRQLLAFARRQQLEPTRIDANKLVAGMSELLRRTLGETIAIETVLAGGLWPTFADANQLENALVNLAVNARDAMPEGGKLTIETANTSLDEAYVSRHDDLAPGQYVLVAVTDTGCGMTREILAKVFEPFFTTKDIGHGTGLGLSQVYGFVKQSGGHVKIYSEPGAGTTVKLYLPRLMTADVQDDSPAPDQPFPRGSQAETILVVEDEEKVRAFSVEMLHELGYAVMAAPNGHAALQLIDAHPEIRLLFTDVGLPGGLNGRQLANEALLRRPDMKVLFTSGYTRNAIIHGDRLETSVALIGKPFTYAALAEKVRHVLNT